MLIPLLIVLLGVLGLANAVHFLRVTYGRDALVSLREIIQQGQTTGPHGKGVGGSADGWLFFGLVPNAVAAIPYYLGVIFLAGLAAVTGAAVWRQALFVLTLVSLPLTVYLVYSLIARLHALCPVCLQGHVINAGLIVMAGWWSLSS